MPSIKVKVGSNASGAVLRNSSSSGSINSAIRRLEPITSPARTAVRIASAGPDDDPQNAGGRVLGQGARQDQVFCRDNDFRNGGRNTPSTNPVRGSNSQARQNNRIARRLRLTLASHAAGRGDLPAGRRHGGGLIRDVQTRLILPFPGWMTLPVNGVLRFAPGCAAGSRLHGDAEGTPGWSVDRRRPGAAPAGYRLCRGSGRAGRSLRRRAARDRRLHRCRE
jgi:hypothetical protein